MADKHRGKSAGRTRGSGSGEPGHLDVDDRGNVTWQWQNDEDLIAEDALGAAERVRALVNPDLEVKDDEPDLDRPGQVNPKGLKSGYNPYNSGPLGKQSWKKKKNLKELSKWIELRKRMEAKKKSGED